MRALALQGECSAAPCARIGDGVHILGDSQGTNDGLERLSGAQNATPQTGDPRIPDAQCHPGQAVQSRALNF